MVGSWKALFPRTRVLNHCAIVQETLRLGLPAPLGALVGFGDLLFPFSKGFWLAGGPCRDLPELPRECLCTAGLPDTLVGLPLRAKLWAQLYLLGAQSTHGGGRLSQ